MGNLLRLALMAGTGAGIAGLRRAGLRLAALLAAAVVGGILLAAALGCFGIAAFIAITPYLGPVWAAAAAGLGYVLAALVLFLACRQVSRRPRRVARSEDVGSFAAPLGALAGIEGLSAVRGVVERNAIPVLIAAFVAGVVAARRR